MRAVTPVLIDEFPYLTAASPALPSYLQRAWRAAMELVVRPFAFREAASFWGADGDLDIAFRLHALVGGTPAYLEMCGGAGPAGAGEFGEWVLRRLLNPASAMFREGGLLLREEPTVTDPTPYVAVLTAVSAGLTRRSQIAAAIGRPSSSLAHLLSGLQDIGLVERVGDALRDKRSVWRIAEPVVRLHQLLIARHEPELVAGLADRVWKASADTVAARIYGPHFEDLARQWCLRHASPETAGGVAASVLPTQIACRQHRHGHELDLVITESVPHGTDRITAIGEAKATIGPVGMSQLGRLEHLRALLPAGSIVDPPKLLLFARSGFTADLAATAGTRGDVELIGLERLYRGA